MEIGLLPKLTVGEKASVKAWMETVLGSPRLVQAPRNNFPLSQRIAIYIDGMPRLVQSGGYQTDSIYIYVGNESDRMGLGERLGILCAIISVSGLWAELADQYSAAVSRSLLESYNTAMQNLIRVQGGVPATGLAFSADRSLVAAQMGGGWFLPGGEAIEIDSTWTVVS